MHHVPKQALAVMEAALVHTATTQQARPLSPTLSSGEEEEGHRGKEGPGALLHDWPTAINPDAQSASKVCLWMMMMMHRLRARVLYW